LNRLHPVARYSLIVVLWLALFYLAIPLPHPLFPDDYSLMIADRRGEILQVFLNRRDHWCLAPELAPEIPEKLKRAVVMYEDRRFYRHWGVNPGALARALRQNLEQRRVVSGASTLTMQVARLMRPKRRTYLNKGLEILQALKLEVLYSKEQILKLYLDHAPYGGNIAGFQAAAFRYFGKPPKALTWAEAATLAVLPNAPGLITPVVRPAQLIAKRNSLLAELFRERAMTESEYRLAIAEPAPRGVRPLRGIAPHACRNLRRKYPNQHYLAATLDAGLQARTAELVKRQAEYLRPLGIHNASALVAETRTGAVRAYVGSQDYWEGSYQGRVDGVQAPRSSGSILKPFLFGMAMDEGLILPRTQLKDVPTFYKEFAPKNYDNQFHGMVTAEEALIRSLNVPAVRLLHQVGVADFYLFLQSAGVQTLFRAPEEYGLPLILGGAETTLWDVAGLYRGLGRLGVFAPLHLAEAERRTHEARLIQPGSAYLALEMLRNLKRPGAEFYWEQYQNQRPVAWKTGTSYGNRDAWAVGVSPEWTVAVWVGNFTGDPNPDLSGASCAGPLLFDIVNSLPRRADAPAWFPRPEHGITQATVCMDTGYVASPACPRTLAVDAPLRARKPLKPCPYHRVHHFSQDRRMTVCSLCWENTGHVMEPRLVYPPHVMQFLREHGQQVTRIPPHNPKCPAAKRERILEIVYPQEGGKIWIPRGVEGSLQRIIAQVSHRDRQCRIFWYVDGYYKGETQNVHDQVLLLGTGAHVLDVVDEYGNRAARRFQTAVKE